MDDFISFEDYSIIIDLETELSALQVWLHHKCQWVLLWPQSTA